MLFQIAITHDWFGIVFKERVAFYVLVGLCSEFWVSDDGSFLKGVYF